MKFTQVKDLNSSIEYDKQLENYVISNTTSNSVIILFGSPPSSIARELAYIHLLLKGSPVHSVTFAAVDLQYNTSLSEYPSNAGYMYTVDCYASYKSCTRTLKLRPKHHQSSTMYGAAWVALEPTQQSFTLTRTQLKASIPVFPSLAAVIPFIQSTNPSLIISFNAHIPPPGGYLSVIPPVVTATTHMWLIRYCTLYGLLWLRQNIPNIPCVSVLDKIIYYTPATLSTKFPTIDTSLEETIKLFESILTTASLTDIKIYNYINKIKMLVS